MKVFSRLGLLFVVLAASGASAQNQIPYIVQLPTQDFVWQWGGRSSAFEERRRPGFEITGVEQNFNCTLTGDFKLGSRMNDFYRQRDFEQALKTTIYFIQDATYALNGYYRSNDLDWAKLDCFIHETELSDEKEQERLDRALERAQRDQERRRRREE